MQVEQHGTGASMPVAAEIVGWTICAISGWHGIETVANLGPLLAGVTLIPHLGVGLLLVVAGRILAAARVSSNAAAEILQTLRES